MASVVLSLIGFSSPARSEKPPSFSVPVSCDPATLCLAQQYPDMAPGLDVVDPFCGKSTYDAHDGTDIRVPSLREMAAGVPVVAMADGRVLRLRDGKPDRLVNDAIERQALSGKECGNGLVIDHGGGWSVQYCHLRQGSLRVQPDQNVARGEPLGLIGASGLAQFPHVHVTVRKDGVALDPSTGKVVGSGCLANAGERRSLWSEEASVWLQAARRHILDVGVVGDPFDYDSLVQDGAPLPLAAGDAAVIGWGWFANLLAGDTIRIRIETPSGDVLIDHVSEGFAKTQAVYLQTAGRRQKAAPGTYRLLVELRRDGSVLETQTRVLEVQ